MITLFAGDIISILTTTLVLAMLAFIFVSFTKRRNIQKWGRLILILVLVGTAISGLSATRDAYMMDGALFAPDSMQSTICSLVGGLIILTGLVSLFVRKQNFRKISFHLISMAFLLQVVTVEASRIALKLGGAL